MTNTQYKKATKSISELENLIEYKKSIRKTMEDELAEINREIEELESQVLNLEYDIEESLWNQQKDKKKQYVTFHKK